MNYYEQLNVSADASKLEIKKAYFAMVKKYPPERFPGEFKEYRKAYDVLSDDNARDQYDKLAKIPEEYKDLYEASLEAMEYGDYESAILELKAVVKEHPDLQILNSLLGDIYLENDNSGNAIKIFEKLTKLEPSNPEYQGKLAEAYQMRGFNKKAVVQYEKTVHMDPDNMDYVAKLANAYWEADAEDKALQTIRQGTALAREKDLDCLQLHIWAISFCASAGHADDLREHMNALKEKAFLDPSIINYISEEITLELFVTEPQTGTIDLYYQVLCFLSELDPKNDMLLHIKEEFETQYRVYQLGEDEQVPATIAFLTELTLTDCQCTSCKIKADVMKQEMLFNINTTRKGLKYVKETYPDIYELNRTFYDDVLNPKKEQLLVDKSYKALQRHQKRDPAEFNEIMNGFFGLDDEDFDEFEIEESTPYVRKDPKVGRNDPCPCGSGKKYKKCCGQNS